MSPNVELKIDDVAEQVHARLLTSDLPLIPKRVFVHEDTDPLGEDAWRLVLVLPAPAGETWDRLEVFQVRRTAVDIFDDIAAQEGRTLPGSTIAVVTTDEADKEETAPEDEPAEGEDPGRP